MFCLATTVMVKEESLIEEDLELSDNWTGCQNQEMFLVEG